MMREHFGPDGGERAAARAARAFQFRRRHPHGAGARRGFVRRAGRHAHRAGRSAQRTTRRRWCCSIPTASWSDASGRRFFDEGAGLVHETWEAFSRRLHFEVPGRTAFAILDARVRAIPDWQRATRSEVPPYEAATLAELAKLIGVDADELARTVADYNAACTGDPQKFDATVCDGLAASSSLAPPKSNWARAIVEPPFLAWPIDRRHRLHLRRARDRFPRARAPRRRADRGPLRRRRDHRALLRHRAERGVGAARVRVRPDRGAGGGGVAFSVAGCAALNRRGGAL